MSRGFVVMFLVLVFWAALVVINWGESTSARLDCGYVQGEYDCQERDWP